MLLPIVITLDNSDCGSEPLEDATSGIRASEFVGIDMSRSFSKIQSRISFGGKVLTFIYLNLFLLLVSSVVFGFLENMVKVNQSIVKIVNIHQSKIDVKFDGTNYSGM